jgi:hypothetical protein
MSLQLKICRNPSGTWSLDGPASLPASDLPSLSASLEHARRACGAAPATIELFIDGMYMVVHQEGGWPRPLLAPKTEPRRQASPGSESRDPPIRGRLLAWLRSFAHEYRSAAPRRQDTSRAVS